ncbi:MAG: hypothetical protein H0U76_15580, partial [Ktedonobacteraceae bacterium]|nr:hypothetical protein [Ktedonobacteraceae bacterium]
MNGIHAVIEERRSTIASLRSSSSDISRSKPIWHVPHRHNPFFTGREDLLTQLRERLTTTNNVALTQAQAISGLGGIGKTQTALEYAYRHRHEYRAILWVSAASRETLLAEFVGLASVLALPILQDQDQVLVVTEVIHWLADNEGWLLILDNADDLDVVEDLLPEGSGHILLTTREQKLGTIAQRVEVGTMDRQEGMILVLRRAGLLAPGTSVEQVPEEQQLRAAAIVDAMDGLPLALDQAGAYIEETGCNLADYLKLYQDQERKTKLLSRPGKRSPSYPHTVATTWTLSFKEVERKSPAAADLLRLCAFLDPDAIPEELLTEGASKLGPVLGPTAADPLRLNDALEVLLSYSLIRRTPESRTLSIHRLVQAVLINGLAPRSRKLWARRTVHAVNQAFPEVDATTWAQCRRYLPHTLACVRLIEDCQLFSPEAADLLNRVGWYFRDHAQYTEAEPLIQQAIVIYEHTVGSDHVDLGSPLNNLGLLYRDQ